MAGRLGKPEYILGLNRVGIRWQYVNWYVALVTDFIAGIFDQEVVPELVEGIDFVFKRFRTLYTEPVTPTAIEDWTGFTFGPSDIGELEKYDFVWGFWVDVEGLKTARQPGEDSNTTFFDPGILFFTAQAFSKTSAAFDATARLTAATDNGNGTVTAYRRFLLGGQLENTFTGESPQVVNTFQAGVDSQFSQTFVFYTKPGSQFIWYRVQQENFNIERAALTLGRDIILGDKETRGNKIRLYGEFTDVDPPEPFMVESEPYDYDFFVDDNSNTTELSVGQNFAIASGIFFDNALLSGTPPVEVVIPVVSGVANEDLIEVDIAEFLIGDYFPPIEFAGVSGVDSAVFEDFVMFSGVIEPIVEVVDLSRLPADTLISPSGLEFLSGEYFRNLLLFTQDPDTIFFNEEDGFETLDGEYKEVAVVFDVVEDNDVNTVEVESLEYLEGDYFLSLEVVPPSGFDDIETVAIEGFTDLTSTAGEYFQVVEGTGISGTGTAVDALEPETVFIDGLNSWSGANFAFGNYFQIDQSLSGLDPFDEVIELQLIQTLQSEYFNRTENYIHPDETLLYSGFSLTGESDSGFTLITGIYREAVLTEFIDENITILGSGLGFEALNQDYFQSVILLTGVDEIPVDTIVASGLITLEDSLYEEVIVGGFDDPDDETIAVVSGVAALVDSFYGLITDEGNRAEDGEADTDTIAISGANFAALASGYIQRVVEFVDTIEENINQVTTVLYSGAITQVVLPTEEIQESINSNTALISGAFTNIVLPAEEVNENVSVSTALVSGVFTDIVLPADEINEALEVTTTLASGLQVVDVSQLEINESIEQSTTLVSGAFFDVILPTDESEEIEVTTALVSGSINSIILDAVDDGLTLDEIDVTIELISGVFTSIILETSVGDTIEAVTVLSSGFQGFIVTEANPEDSIEVATELVSGALFNTVQSADTVAEEIETLTVLTSGHIEDVRLFTEIAESIDVGVELISGVSTLFDPDPDEIVIETILGNYLIYSGVIL